MIVVAGRFAAARSVAGSAFAVAAAAAAAGARVEAVGVMAEGPDGDRAILGLASAGIGHAAMLRANRAEMERADLELALQYLPDTRVIVLVDLPEELVTAASAAASWSSARLVVVTARGAVEVDEMPRDAIVLEAPAADPDATFAGLVADLACRLDAGDDARAAWEGSVRATAAEPVRASGI